MLNNNILKIKFLNILNCNLMKKLFSMNFGRTAILVMASFAMFLLANISDAKSQGRFLPEDQTIEVLGLEIKAISSNTAVFAAGDITESIASAKLFHYRNIINAIVGGSGVAAAVDQSNAILEGNGSLSGDSVRPYGLDKTQAQGVIDAALTLITN
jgi:hypothetical protein